MIYPCKTIQPQHLVNNIFYSPSWVRYIKFQESLESVFFSDGCDNGLLTKYNIYYIYKLKNGPANLSCVGHRCQEAHPEVKMVIEQFFLELFRSCVLLSDLLNESRYKYFYFSLKMKGLFFSEKILEKNYIKDFQIAHSDPLCQLKTGSTAWLLWSSFR